MLEQDLLHQPGGQPPLIRPGKHQPAGGLVRPHGEIPERKQGQLAVGRGPGNDFAIRFRKQSSRLIACRRACWYRFLWRIRYLGRRCLDA